MTPPATGPHQGQPIGHSGDPLERARAAALLLHGRGASAADTRKPAASCARK